MDSLGVELAGAGILLATIAMLGAWVLSLNIAGAQLARFRADRANRGSGAPSWVVRIDRTPTVR